MAAKVIVLITKTTDDSPGTPLRAGPRGVAECRKNQTNR